MDDDIDIEEQLRQTLNDCPISARQISLATGITTAQLSRFKHGKVKLMLASAAKLAKYFGMKLTKPKYPKV